MTAGQTRPAGAATTYQAAEVQSSSPRRPREGATVRNQLNSWPRRDPGCQVANTSPAADDRADDALASTRDHASATRDRCRMSREQVTGRGDRRSRTPPVAISIQDDASRREQQLTRTLNSPSRSGQRIGVQRRRLEGARSASGGLRPLQHLVGQRLRSATGPSRTTVRALGLPRLVLVHQSVQGGGFLCERRLVPDLLMPAFHESKLLVGREASLPA